MDRYKAPAVKKAFEVLKVMADAGKPLSLTDISRELGINKSSALGLLRALEDVGVVKRDPKTKKYERTPKLLDYAVGLDSSHLLVEASKGLLEEISDKTSESVFLGHVKGDLVTIVRVSVGKGEFVLTSTPGTKIPSSVGALGRAVLGFQKGERGRYYIDRGGEYLPGVSAVCTPIALGNRLYGMLWLAGYNIPEDKLEDYGKLLINYAREIEKRMEGEGD